MRGYWWMAILCCSLVGCGSSDDDDGATPKSVTLTGTTACERADSLALALGCVPLGDCEVEPACDTLAVTWVDCAAEDTRQCICDSDGDLNCEGSFKANEGPALCGEEHQAFADCAGE